MLEINRKKPHVSILMPIYNAERYLRPAIDSILNQTYKDFELILINDGSDDGSREILSEYKDQRIIIIDNEVNKGLITTLNVGLGHARGTYIARMDADDVCLPKRLAQQVEFLDINEDVVMVGGSHTCWYDSSTRNQLFPLDYDSIKAEALFNCPFSHITVMLRKAYLDANNLKYEHDYKFAEDYALWQKIISNAKCCNLPVIMAKYRFVQNGQTAQASSRDEERFQVISKIQNMGLSRLGIINSDREARLHYALSLSDRIRTLQFQEYSLTDIEAYLNKIVVHNNQNNYCSPKKLLGILGKIWIKIFIFHFRRLSVNEIKGMLFSKFFTNGALGLMALKTSFKLKTSNFEGSSSNK